MAFVFHIEQHLSVAGAADEAGREMHAFLLADQQQDLSLGERVAEGDGVHPVIAQNAGNLAAADGGDVFVGKRTSDDVRVGYLDELADD